MGAMKAVFRHVNIIAADWERLARFYEEVFGCVRIPPERRISEPWLAKGTGVKGAALRGIKLALPGCGAGGPSLEVFQFDVVKGKPPAAANRRGYGHLAFEVEDAAAALREVVARGGSALGVVASHEDERGIFTFVFASDPEGNILELTHWKKKQTGPGHDLPP